MKYLRILSYISLILLITACAGDTAPGTFSVTFQWEDPPPEDTSTLGVWGKVEQDGRQVSESDVLTYANNIELKFSNVPNGAGLVIVVEIKESVSKNSRTLYYGRSDSFELKAGEHVDVPVSLSLIQTPLAADGEGAVSIVEKQAGGNYGTLHYTNQTIVTLALTAPGNCGDPCTLIVSNTSDFRIVEESLPTLEGLAKDGEAYIKSDWDLNLGGLDLDGMRTVYVKFRNADAYESEVATGTVTVDRLAPNVATGSVSPPYTNGALTVTMTPNDILDLNISPILYVFRKTGQGRKLLISKVMTNSGGGEAFFFSGTLADIADDPSTLDGETLVFEIEMTDKAGNSSEDRTPLDNEQDIMFQTVVDLTPPDVMTYEIRCDSDFDMTPDDTDKYGEPDFCWFVSAKAGHNRMLIETEFFEDPGEYGDRWKLTLDGKDIPPENCQRIEENLNWGHYCGHTVEEDDNSVVLRILNLEVRDRANNQTIKEGSVSYDFKPPEVVVAAVSPALAPLDSYIWYQVTFNEELRGITGDGEEPHLIGTDGSKTLDFGVPEAIDTPRKVFSWGYEVESTEDTGKYSAKVNELCDTLDNCINDLSLNLQDFEIDALVPEEPLIATSWEGCSGEHCDTFSAESPHNNMIIKITFSEAPAYYWVSVGGEWLSEDACQANSGKKVYTCTHVVSGNPGESGRRSVVAHYEDAAGNSSETEHEVYFDFDPPEVADSYCSPQPANLSSHIRYQVLVNETLNEADSKLNLVCDLGDWSAASYSSRSVSWDREVVVIAADHGEHTVQVLKLCDLYGNCDENVAVQTIIIDAQASEVQDLMVCYDDGSNVACTEEDDTFSAKTGFKEMKVSFTLSETPRGFPEIRVDDDAISAASCSVDGNDYVCRKEVIDPKDGTEPRTEVVAVSVTTEDDAGNRYFDSLTVTYDFQPPYLIGTALLERCDNYAPARMVQDDLWVKKGDQCISEDNELCEYKGGSCPYDYNVEIPDKAIVTRYAPVRVSFALQEDSNLGEHGIYVNDQSGGSFELTSGSTTTYKIAYYSVFTDGPIPDDPLEAYRVLPVKGHVVDSYGNENEELSIATLRFDYSDPSSPDVDTSNVVTYHRIPWGSDATGGEPKMWVEGQSGAVESYDRKENETHGTIKIYRPGPQTLLAEGETNNDGSFDALEFGADLPEVEVAFWDPAGNESETAIVRDVSWTATMGYKVPGSLQENPNVLLVAPYFLFGLLFQDEMMTVEPTEEELGKIVLSESRYITLEGEQNWMQLPVSELKPSTRTEFGMAYDSARGKIVLFGGRDGDTPYKNDTWEWDVKTRTWEEVLPLGVRPSGRYGHALTYDSKRGKTILFGGIEGAVGGPQHYTYYKYDTWEWDGEEHTWREVTPTQGTNPHSRECHAMVYDSNRGKVVLFGGKNTDIGGGLPEGIYEWDGVLGTWTKIVPSGNTPSSRYRCYLSMAYDIKHEKVVMFGGFDGGSSQDTWEWDGENRTWTDVTPSEGIPSARGGHAMIYDIGLERVMLFGGQNGTLYNDVWVWDEDLHNWNLITPDGSIPSGRANHSMIYDSVRNISVLFGGNDGSFKQDIWEFDSTTESWIDVTQTGSKPSARTHHAMALDSVRNKVVLFGGYQDDFDNKIDDTWEWDWNTGTWRNVTTSGNKPSARSHHTMVYDNKNNNVVLFGGHDGATKGDTWEWVGTSKTWTNVTPEGSNPRATWGHAMTYDSLNDRILLYGMPDEDTGVNNIFEWNGTEQIWTEIVFEGDKPTSGAYHVITFDASTDHLILYGGLVGLEPVRDTWEWDAVLESWAKCIPVDQPTWRTDTTMVYDFSRKKTMLFGGDIASWNGDIRQNDMWEWISEIKNWHNVTPTGNLPNPRLGHAMIYYDLHSRAFLFGGEDDWGDQQDTWIRDGAADKTGAVLFEAKFAETGTDYHAEIQSMTATMYTGGSAHSNDGEDGSILYIWDTHPGNWRELAANVAAVDNPDILQYTTDDPDELRHLFLGDDLSLNFAITPTYPNGTSTKLSEIAVDYVEATVKYRLPAESEIDCTNGEDDDADSLTDCEDDDCVDDPTCASEGDGDSDSDEEFEEYDEYDEYEE